MTDRQTHGIFGRMEPLDADDPANADPKWSVLFSSASVNWSTPDAAFKWAEERFGPFTLDVAADDGNARASQFITAEQNALLKPWAPHRCWMNPPYDQCDAFIRKAAGEVALGAAVVALVPARTDTRWFHEIVIAGRYPVWFARGRIKFGGSSNGAPFPSMCVVMEPPVGRSQYV